MDDQTPRHARRALVSALGALLLAATVGLVSCQTFLAPWLHPAPATVRSR